VDIRAKVTVLAEGAHGSLTEELLRHFALHREAPQSYSLGLKEVWELEEEPEKEGKVIHTIGFPLSVSAGGGGFLYCHGGMLSVGLVSPLAGANLALDPHEEFQRFKNHPFIARYLGKGRLAHAGAKIIPEGGFFSIPPVVVPGGLIVGDSAGLLNSLQLKGIHLAMKSGMLAADSIVEAWSGEGPVLESLHNFAQKLQESFIGKQLSAVRHFQHQMRNGVLPGLLKGTLHTLMGAHRPMGFPETKPVRRNTQKKAVGSRREPVPFDQRLSFDKATTLFYSGVRHEEDQPPHLLISDFSVCRERCTEEFGNPCRHFCPAEVFEVLEDPSSGQRYPRLLPSNCLHCKACEIADPYGIIRWIPPEGGGGPNYRNL
jgi:electron-transferring-flavoprotein dehydrogenase